MDLDARYEFIREKLYAFGFDQHLPIGSLSLVSAILDDLVKTTENLKKYKEEHTKLSEEKAAWELGVEPYKCDNSKLLSECNSLHLQLIRQKDQHHIEIVELERRIRQLEIDKKHLQDHCAHLESKVREIEMHASDPRIKHKKPFISAVRSGDTFSNPPLTCQHQNKCISGCICFSAKIFSSEDSNIEVKKLQSELKTQIDLMSVFKKQLESRDREIARLNTLLIGGRPVAALGRDCCYRGVDNLQEDVKNLQKEKCALKAQLQRTVMDMHETMERAINLDKRNQKLQKELNEMEKIALSVESEANTKFIDKKNECRKLELKLDEVLQKVAFLESNQNVIKSTKKTTENERANLRASLKDVKNENNNLKEKLNLLITREKDLTMDNEKLLRKIEKLKLKIQDLQHEHESIKEKAQVNTNELFEFQRLKSEKDYFEREYHKLLSNPDLSLENEVLKNKLEQKQIEIDNLQQKSHRSDENMLNNLTNRSAMNRLEREKELQRNEIEQLTMERNDLRNRLQIATETQITGHRSAHDKVHDLTRIIDELEIKNRRLEAGQLSSKTSIEMLKAEIDQLRAKIGDEQKDNAKLKSSFNHVKVLQQQTEIALSDYQNRLSQTENQLDRAASQLSTADSNRDIVYQEINSLKEDLARLKAKNLSLENEKDKLIADLDCKTEKLFHLDGELMRYKSQNAELESKIDVLQRRLGNATDEQQYSEDTLRKVSSETESLRKQVAQLKRLNDNALTENSRLLAELSDQEHEHQVVQNKLKISEKEVERLKGQLKQYVQEVERAEELLRRKEDEREEILDTYKTLSQDALALEGSNQSLELAATTAKRRVLEAEARIVDLEEQLGLRENEIHALERQVCEMSKQIAALEAELETCSESRSILKADADAVKDLCNKLDVEKDKLKAELNECAEIKAKLERDNAKLLNDMTLRKSNDKATVGNLQERLSSTKQETEQLREASNQQTQEIQKLRTKIDELQQKLNEEHGNSVRNETLAKEYSIQIEELRRRLVDERFAMEKSQQQKSDKEADRYSSLNNHSKMNLLSNSSFEILENSRKESGFFILKNNNEEKQSNSENTFNKKYLNKYSSSLVKSLSSNSGFSESENSLSLVEIYKSKAYEPKVHEPKDHEPKVHEPEVNEPEVHEPEFHEPEVYRLQNHEPGINIPEIRKSLTMTKCSSENSHLKKVATIENFRRIHSLNLPKQTEILTSSDSSIFDRTSNCESKMKLCDWDSKCPSNSNSLTNALTKRKCLTCKSLSWPNITNQSFGKFSDNHFVPFSYGKRSSDSLDDFTWDIKVKLNCCHCNSTIH